MRFLDEYRQAGLVSSLCSSIAQHAKKNIRIMEVCGGQTHSIVKYGLEQLLPKNIELIHGPGCPVCVTDISQIDKAIEIAKRADTILCSFGDMMRVPGSRYSLLDARALGADIRVVYSPLDALKIAKNNEKKKVVFFAVGFETTAPATALTVLQAELKGIDNLSLLVSHVLVPPAMQTLLQSRQCNINAFLAAGHVCAVMGYKQYEPLAKKFRVPIVVTGFEPVDIMQGIDMCVKQLSSGRSQLENQYARAVQRDGNMKAQEIIAKVFEVSQQRWRGIGAIDQSGLRLRHCFKHRDACVGFDLDEPHDVSHNTSACISGEVLQGLKKPPECKAFGGACTPEHPLGAPMVSSEGACAAYYRYTRLP